MKNDATILIIDDEPAGRELLEAHLFPQGHKFAFASNGAEALESIGELAPDVILLDVMMPGLTGFEVCQHLKADERWQHIPIILVTALDSKADLVRGFEAGADDFLHKPVNGLELRARVRSMLRIKKQHDELEARYKKLEFTLQLREDLASMLVHDMKLPLTTIMGYSELMLKRSRLAPKYLKDIDTVRRQAQRLHAYVNDLLIMAKMEDGELILHRSAVDVNQIVREVAESHRVIAQSRKIKLVTEMPEVCEPISLDINLFQRALDNLISNALKFSPTGRTVTLRVEYFGTDNKSLHTRILVLDEGPGIAPENRERIFDKFEIVALKQTDVPQVGLGLAFCKLVVEAHGGYISVEGNKPTGSIFTVEI